MNHPAKDRSPTIRLIAGTFGMLAAIAGQVGIRDDRKSVLATVAFLVGSLLVAVATRWGHREEPEPPMPRPGPGNRRSAGIAMLAIAASALIAGPTILLVKWHSGFYLGWGLLLAGTAACSYGLHLLDPPLPRVAWSKRELIIFLGIFLLGTALRLYRFGEFPDGFTTHAIEEQETGLGGYRVLNLDARPWEFFLDYQLTALAQWIDPDSTFTTIRVPYVIISILTIIPVHLFFRQLLSVPAALAATFLYSASSWNLLYSRCAHPIFSTIILINIAFALLVHFGRTRRWVGVPWIGFLCGNTLYAYAGFRGTPLFAAVFFAGLFVAALRRRDRADMRRIALAFAVFASVVVACVAPLVPLLTRGPNNYYFEAAQRSMANKDYYTDDRSAFWAQRLERIRDASAIFTHFGDGSPTFNDPTTPMLDPVTAVLAAIGLFLMLLHPLRRYNAFMLFVPLVLMTVGTVFVQNLDVRRLGGMTLFVALAAGHACEALWDSVGRWSSWLRRIGLALAVLAGAAVVGWTFRLYFIRMGDSPEIRRAYKDHYTTMIHFGHDHGRGRKILLLSFIHRFFDASYHYRMNYSWLIDPVLQGRSLRDVNDLVSRVPLPKSALPRTVVAQRPFEVEAIADLIRQAYPGSKCEDFSEPDNRWVGVIGCDLPDPLVRANVELELSARYWLNEAGEGQPSLERNEPFLGFATIPSICYGPSPKLWCRAEWDGRFEVPKDSDYQLLAESNGPTKFELLLDGERIERFPVPIHSGPHTVKVTARLPRDWENGVRLSLAKEGTPKVIRFYRVIPNS